MAENNNNKPQVRVASIEVELGMSVQNKAGIWCKPTTRMVLTVGWRNISGIRERLSSNRDLMRYVRTLRSC